MNKTELRLTCVGGVLLAALAVTTIPFNWNTGGDSALVNATVASSFEAARTVQRVTRRTAKVSSPAGRYVYDVQRVATPAGRYVDEVARVASPSGRYVSHVARVASPAGRYVWNGQRVASPADRYVWEGVRTASPAGRYVDAVEDFARARPPAGRYVTLPATNRPVRDASLFPATPGIAIAANYWR